MSKHQKETKNINWEVIFHAETPQHIFFVIKNMENEVFREFQLKLGPDVVINNYMRLKFILSRAMSE